MLWTRAAAAITVFELGGDLEPRPGWRSPLRQHVRDSPPPDSVHPWGSG